MITLKVGDKAPDFNLTGNSGKKVKLSGFKGNEKQKKYFIK